MTGYVQHQKDVLTFAHPGFLRSEPPWLPSELFPPDGGCGPTGPGAFPAIEPGHARHSGGFEEPDRTHRPVFGERAVIAARTSVDPIRLSADRSVRYAPIQDDVHPSPFTLHTSHFALHSQHSTLHTPLFTLHPPHSTLHTPLSTLHSELSSVESVKKIVPSDARFPIFRV